MVRFAQAVAFDFAGCHSFAGCRLRGMATGDLQCCSLRGMAAAFTLVMAGAFAVGFLAAPQAVLQSYLGEVGPSGRFDGFSEETQRVLLVVASIVGYCALFAVALLAVVCSSWQRLGAQAKLCVWLAVLCFWLLGCHVSVSIRRDIPYMSTPDGRAANPAFLDVEWDDWIGVILALGALAEDFGTWHRDQSAAQCRELRSHLLESSRI